MLEKVKSKTIEFLCKVIEKYLNDYYMDYLADKQLDDLYQEYGVNNTDDLVTAMEGKEEDYHHREHGGIPTGIQHFF